MGLYVSPEAQRYADMVSANYIAGAPAYQAPAPAYQAPAPAPAPTYQAPTYAESWGSGGLIEQARLEAGKHPTMISPGEPGWSSDIPWMPGMDPQTQWEEMLKEQKPPGLTPEQVQAMIKEALAGQSGQYQQQLAGLTSQLGQQSAAYQGQINELMGRMQAEQVSAQQAQADYMARLAEADQQRQAIEQRVAHYTSPAFMEEGAGLAREHMLLGQEADEARILQAILQGAEGRGMVHSGVLPGLQQQAAQHLDEQYSKKALDIAQQLALMGVQGAEGEFNRYLQQLGLEQGALTRGQELSWNQLANMMGFQQTGQQAGMAQALQAMGLGMQGNQFAQTHALQQFNQMAPYMLMTQAEQASHVRQMLQQMGVPTGNLTEADLQQIFNSLTEAGGGL